MREVSLYTDGAARGNPGPGGYGCVLHYTDGAGELHVRELSAGYRETTNNRMELMAAIAGLEALNQPCRVTLYSDSQYVIKAFTDDWISGWVRRGWKNAQKKPVKNPDLWQRLLKAVEPHEMSYVWVKGHAGHPENERCDELATAAADAAESTLLVDEGFSRESLL